MSADQAVAAPSGAESARRAGRARRRDRLVYLRSHPVLFTLLAATRRAPVRRIGRTVLVHGTRAYLDALTRVPLDRTAEGTTGGTASRLAEGGLLFDQEGTVHKGARRSLADDLGSAGVVRLRPVWTAVLERRLAPLATGGTVDLVDITAELAGATTAALLDLDTDPLVLADAARHAAATGAGQHMPGPRLPGAARAARLAADALTDLVRDHAATRARCPAGAVPPVAGDGPARTAGTGTAAGGEGAAGLAAMLAVAAINTTVAAIPRAAAWCADDDLWHWADDAATRPTLVAELLRVTAPTPLLPRVAAASGTVDGCPVRAGDRLALIARHAVDAHRTDPSRDNPAPPQVAQLVFGAGPHACPGAALARAQLADTLAALTPYRPKVVRARADRRAALPGWAVLTVRATR
ncbi:cytochrome P450 [Polymorphospora sp. NPDC051019]|uniref:cytochrome P450 n=1 Tax=Polymorphospora sp. NPDC051019 TaxID=3155725 RepID=UPI0034197710